MSSFLNTLTFLTPEQRALLVDADLDEPSAFQHLSHEKFVDKFLSPPYGLSEGKVGRLFTATRLQTTAATPTKVEVTLPESLSRGEQIERALRASKLDVLRDLGVTYVVASWGVLDADATMELFASNPSRMPPTWRGKKVVALSDLAGVERYRNPRNGSELQGLGVTGVDEVTSEPWGALGLDGLCVAAFGEAAGFFAGMTDAAVIDAMMVDSTGTRKPLRARIEKRMEVTDTKHESLKERVIVRDKRGDPRASPVLAKTNLEPYVPRQRQILGPNLASNLSNLLVRMFDAGELRRFLRFGPDGTYITNQLPEQTTLANLAFEAAGVLDRRGGINRELRNRLVLERPKLVADIDAIFGAAGLI